MNIIRRLKARAEFFKKEIEVLYYASRCPELPVMPKIVIIITLAYALSPIDLIPDFIPVLGYLDDLVIIPALIIISIKLIPVEIIEKSKIKAENEPVKLRKNLVAAVAVIVIWIIFFLFIASLFFKKG